MVQLFYQFAYFSTFQLCGFHRVDSIVATTAMKNTNPNTRRDPAPQELVLSNHNPRLRNPIPPIMRIIFSLLFNLKFFPRKFDAVTSLCLKRCMVDFAESKTTFFFLF